MSLKSVLTALSNAVQTKANMTGPLTLQEMTDAVKSISSSSSSQLNFYRCAEYHPASSVFYITEGVTTLADGRKISLIGEYIAKSSWEWICPATTAKGDYISAEITLEISPFTSTGGGGSGYNLRLLHESKEIASATVYSIIIENITFSSVNSAVFDEDILLAGDSGYFNNCFSGYKITLNEGDQWKESSDLSLIGSVSGYIPEPGKIYSQNTYTIISSRYPNIPDELIKFYECSSVNTNDGTWSGYEMMNNLTEYIFEVRGAENADCNGIYYCVELASLPLYKAYSNGKYYIASRMQGSDKYSWVISDSIEVTENSVTYYKTDSFEKSQVIPPHEANWIAPELQVTAVPAGWVKTGKLLENIPIKGYTPQVGRIYSSNSTLKLEAAYPDEENNAIEFYECASYTPNADAYTRISMTLSGAADEKANGTYVRTKWVETVPEEWTDTPIAVWTNENGYTLKEYYYSELNYSIYDSTGSVVYTANEPYWSRVTDFNTVPWVDSDAAELDHTLTFSAWQTEEVPATTEGWTGYKMNWVDSSVVKITGDDILVSGDDNTFLNGTYSLSGEGSSRTWSLSIDDGMDKAIISYVTDAVYGDLYPGWTLRLESSAESYYTNTEAGADASITEICTGTWQKDLAGSSTIPTFGVETTETSVPAHWEKSDTLTEDLTVEYLTPKVGEIYSADTTIRVRKMYDGATFPIPSEGLVFYAPLATDYVDQISGKAAAVTGGTFTTHNGLSCLQLDGSEYVKWADNSDLPTGNGACSMVILAAPTNGSDWRTFLTVGDDSYLMDLAAKNGHFQEWGGESITADGKWQSLIITRADTSAGTAYLNGKLNGSGSTHVDNDLPAPGWVCAGAEPRVSYGYKVQGYIAFAAVYNRELSAEEAAEIHAVLMEDVEQ